MIIPMILLLMIPFIAMQFTGEVQWTLGDFVIAGLILLGTGLIIDFTIRKINQPSLRFILIALICIGFFLFWAELAVGIFGTPLSGS